VYDHSPHRASRAERPGRQHTARIRRGSDRAWILQSRLSAAARCRALGRRRPRAGTAQRADRSGSERAGRRPRPCVSCRRRIAWRSSRAPRARRFVPTLNQ